MNDKKQLLLSIPVNVEELNFHNLVKSLAEQFDQEIIYNEDDISYTIPLAGPVTGDHPVEDAEEEPPIERVFETTVVYGVNFRTQPSTSNGDIIRMLRRGEKIHVVEEVDGGGWLKVEVPDDNEEGIVAGYVSSNTKYTDYVASSTDRDILADKMIAFGEKYMGIPYQFGAKLGDTTKFDCSSFVYHVVKEVLGVTLPRTSYNQAKNGVEVNKEDIQKGDLLFFTSRDLPIGHVGIYAGNDRILHTYGSGGVRYTGFKGTQWERRFTKATRIF